MFQYHCQSLNQAHVNALYLLEPANCNELAKFPVAIEFAKKGVTEIEFIVEHTKRLNEDLSGRRRTSHPDLPTDEHPISKVTDDAPDSVVDSSLKSSVKWKYWCLPMSGLNLTRKERAEIFLRWRDIGKPLLMFTNVVKGAESYVSLNVVNHYRTFNL